MSELKGLIKCLDCGKKYKQKRERGKIKFVCSGYDNKSSNCERFVLKETDLMDILHKHAELYHYDLEHKTIREYINSVEVEKQAVKIIYYDGSTSVWGNNKLEF